MCAVAAEHAPNIQASASIHTHHVHRTCQEPLTLLSCSVCRTILARVAPLLVNTTTSVTEVGVTFTLIDVLVAVVPSPAGGTDTNGP